jgi:hypothetical protein
VRKRGRSGAPRIAKKTVFTKKTDAGSKKYANLNLAHGLLEAFLAKSSGPSICSVDFAASGRRSRRALQK